MTELKQALEEGRLYVNAQKRSDYDPTLHSDGSSWKYADSLIRELLDKLAGEQVREVLMTASEINTTEKLRLEKNKNKNA